MNDNFENKRYQYFFERLKQKSNQIGRSRTVNERYEKSRTSPSLLAGMQLLPIPLYVVLYTCSLNVKIDIPLY